MNIFIEGIQGMGKTTLLQKLEQKYPKFLVYREGDYCPIELAWCAYMSEEEYAEAVNEYPSLKSEIEQWTTREEDQYIIAYTRILTDIPGFHKYMEQFEIYNGRYNVEDFEKIIMKRYENFSGNEENHIFECAIFQNIMEELILFQEMSDTQIISFYKRLFEKINQKDFLLYYLYGENIEENIRQIREERSDEKGNQIWYQLVMEYLKKSPYGVKNDIKSFEDMMDHFRHRQELEMRIMKEMLGDSAIVLLAKKYTEKDILLSK